MIRIGSKYAIKADVECWQFGVYATGTDKDGNPTEYIQNPRYPISLASALEKYVDREVRDANPRSWEDVRQALAFARAEVGRVADALEAA